MKKKILDVVSFVLLLGLCLAFADAIYWGVSAAAVVFLVVMAAFVAPFAALAVVIALVSVLAVLFGGAEVKANVEVKSKEDE